jgi:hypothetical protein
MTTYKYGLDPGIVEVIKRIASSLDEDHPMEGTIVDVDGSYANVRTAGKGTILRHCPVIGEPGTLVPGQLVALRWINERPFVLATFQPTSAITQQTFQPDGITLENSPYGIRIIPGSIRQSHLGFFPALEGHTHGDSLTMNGWSVDDDGVITQGNVNIHPTGQISLGLSPNVIKLDAQHSTHRIWVGDVLPANADFSVEKDGKMNASAGTIAGWDILSDRLSKNGAELRAEGELVLGSVNDVFYASAVNLDDYRLWIGHADPDLAPFRVKKSGEVWLDNAHIAMTLESSNYIAGQQGWKLDNTGWAEFQEVTVRGTFTAVTFKNDITSVLSGKQVVTDGATLINDVAATDSTIDLDVNIFDQNDILFTQPRPGISEHMQVLSGPTAITGGYRYDVYRDLANLSDYFTDVETTVGAANLAGYWKMNEVSGSTAYDASDAGNNGAYTAVALMNRPNPVPVGGFAPKFVPPNSLLDIYSTGFNTDFNGAEGSFGMWAKISDSSVWTDGTQDWLMFLYIDTSNYFQILKNTSNSLLIRRTAGGTTKTVSVTYSNTEWFHIGMTWSEAANEFKAYINGVQTGSTQVSIGTWSGGSIATTGAVIGGYHTYWTDRKWDGWLSTAFFATTPISAANMLSIGSPNGSGVTLYAGENIFRKGSGTLPDPSMPFGSYDIWMGGYETSFGGHAIERAGGYLTLDGSRDIGPFFGVARRFGANYDQIQDVVRIGRLEGFLQIPGNQYGIGIGDLLRNMTYTYEDGLQIKTRGGLSRIDDDGITSDQFSVEPTTDPPDYILDRAILYVDQSTNQLRVRFRDATTESDKLVVQL